MAGYGGSIYTFVESRAHHGRRTGLRYLSEEIREQLERYAKAHGVKKGHLVEEALRHHLEALHELPADVIIPPKLVLTKTSFEAVAGRIAKPRKPTAAMKALMAGESSKTKTGPQRRKSEAR